MSEQTELALAGKIYAILAGQFGVELSIIPENKQSDVAPPTWGNYTCILSESCVHLPLMLEMAKTAMMQDLTVWLSGCEEDQNGKLLVNEIRIFNGHDVS